MGHIPSRVLRLRIILACSTVCLLLIDLHKECFGHLNFDIDPLHADSITGVVQDLPSWSGASAFPWVELLAWTSCAPAAYRRQKIIFAPVSASEKVVHFETQIHYLSVKARIDGQEVGLLVDSGLGDCLSFATGCGPRRNNSMSIRMLQYPPLGIESRRLAFR
jgi:hypothetical protein